MIDKDVIKGNGGGSDFFSFDGFFFLVFELDNFGNYVRLFFD